MLQESYLSIQLKANTQQLCVCVCMHVCVCVRVCVHACVGACVRAYLHACVVYMCMCADIYHVRMYVTTHRKCTVILFVI